MSKRPKAADAITPRDPTPPKPPDVVTETILSFASPTYDSLADKHQSDLDNIAEVYAHDMGEKRLLLLAMLVMEDALWKKDGWSKKERFDAAYKAATLVNGTKASVFVNDVADKGAPKTLEELDKAKEDARARLQTLLLKEAATTGSTRAAAMDVIAAYREGEGNGEN